GIDVGLERDAPFGEELLHDLELRLHLENAMVTALHHQVGARYDRDLVGRETTSLDASLIDLHADALPAARRELGLQGENRALSNDAIEIDVGVLRAGP